MTTKEWWKGFVCQVFVNAGYKGNPGALRGVFDVLWKRFEDGTDWEAIPHSHEALAALKNAGIKLGIVSNFDESLEKTLCVNHLDQYFDFVVTAASSGTEKPDPAIFRRALSMSGMTPSVSAHVGDNVSHDYLTPKSIGMTAFLFIQESAPVGESLEKVDQKDIIRDLLDLNKIVTRN